MKQIQFKCDGCDKIAIVEKDNAIPLNWKKDAASVRQDIYENVHFDLCSDCHNQFLKLADPRRWPRTRPSVELSE